MTEYSEQILTVISSLETQLVNLTNEQNSLLEKITTAKDGSVSKEELDQIKAIMNKVSVYHTKLLSLKATMTMLTGRSKQLLNKANKLKETKKQYLLQVDGIRLKEQEKDQAIAAKTLVVSVSETSKSPGTPETVPGTPIHSSPSSTPATPDIPSAPGTPVMSKSIPKLVSVKKKKKTKGREVVLGDESSPAWIPKKSQSQKDLFEKKQ